MCVARHAGEGSRHDDATDDRTERNEIAAQTRQAPDKRVLADARELMRAGHATEPHVIAELAMPPQGDRVRQDNVVAETHDNRTVGLLG